MFYLYFQFSRHLIQSATLIVNNCLSDNVDLYMRLHPDTDINGAFASYFEYPDSIVRLVSKLTYHHFSYYIQQSNPGSADCSEAIVDYLRLLHTASKSKDFVARQDKLFLDATDLMKILRCLCSSAKNRTSLVQSPDFHRATTSFLLGKGENEIKCTLNLLLTCLTEGQPIITTNSARGKAKTNQPPQGEDSREQVRGQLLSHFPEIIPQLEVFLASQRHGELKKLCSAVLWYIQAAPGE